jgi:hypothetical protein
MKKSNTASTLEKIIAADFDSQVEFAQLCGVERSKLNRDITGRSSNITDEQFSTYLRHLDPESQIKMIQARLMDVIPEDLHSTLIFNNDSKLQEKLPSFAVFDLSSELQSALEWLGHEVARFPELEEPILTICRRLGWQPNEQKNIKY